MNEQEKVDEWNNIYRVGTRVRLVGFNDDTKTNTKAAVGPDGLAMVGVDTVLAPRLLRNVTPVKQILKTSIMALFGAATKTEKKEK